MSDATILIVEDEDSLRETLTRFLKREGHQVLSAANGREAIDEAVSACPDVLVADWMLKDHLHGLHVSEAFRAVNPNLNTILITGFPSQDLLAESDRCGVLQLLEKPFDLQELKQSVDRALQLPPPTSPSNRAVAVSDLDEKGMIRFASPRAWELFSAANGGVRPDRGQDVFGEDLLSLLRRSGDGWTPVAPQHLPDAAWLLRARQRDSDGGWLVVVCPESEQGRTTDPRIRILLDHRSRSTPILPDHGPVVVIEQDGALRKLLVSQIERIGALCYPTDDLDAALKLLSAEPRARTVLIDFELAGREMSHWVDAVTRVRAEARVIGTGGSGSEEDLLGLGVVRVLRKPWRITDLLDALSS